MPLFESRPGVVMLQECHLPQSALGEMRRMVHKRLPAYCVFECRPNQSARRDTLIQVVTLVHYLLAARASLLDVTSQLEALGSEAPEARSRTHFLRVLDPLSHVSLLLGNVYQYQAEQPGQQAALLKLMSSVVERWGGQADHVIIGGDWNASLRPRIGYSGHALITRADARLRAWCEAENFACEAPVEPTWSSVNDSRRAVLDCFFWKSKSGQPSISNAETFLTTDPTLDHCGVKVLLREPEIGEMPQLEALWRPERLRLDSWRDKRQEWQDAVERELAVPAAELESDPFLALERAKDVALSAAREILGCRGASGGKLSPITRRISNAPKLVCGCSGWCAASSTRDRSRVRCPRRVRCARSGMRAGTRSPRRLPRSLIPGASSTETGQRCGCDGCGSCRMRRKRRSMTCARRKSATLSANAGAMP